MKAKPAEKKRLWGSSSIHFIHKMLVKYSMFFFLLLGEKKNGMSSWTSSSTEKACLIRGPRRRDIHAVALPAAVYIGLLPECPGQRIVQCRVRRSWCLGRKGGLVEDGFIPVQLPLHRASFSVGRSQLQHHSSGGIDSGRSRADVSFVLARDGDIDVFQL